jgi:hydrogenase nickel incorporation protein HypA/HybF
MFTKEILAAIKKKLSSEPIDTQIKAVSASLSPLSHVRPDTLAVTFNTMIKGTEFERIKLNLKILPLEIKCRACNHRTSIDKPIDACPKCHSSDLDILHSKEFAVDSFII